MLRGWSLTGDFAGALHFAGTGFRARTCKLPATAAVFVLRTGRAKTTLGSGITLSPLQPSGHRCQPDLSSPSGRTFGCQVAEHARQRTVVAAPPSSVCTSIPTASLFYDSKSATFMVLLLLPLLAAARPFLLRRRHVDLFLLRSVRPRSATPRSAGRRIRRSRRVAGFLQRAAQLIGRRPLLLRLGLGRLGGGGLGLGLWRATWPRWLAVGGSWLVKRITVNA
jgi:hypothetical protein